MEYKIYALKLKHSEEIKYIGYTSKSIEERFYEHMKTTIRGNYKNGYWLKKYKGDIEVVLIENGIFSFEEACIKEINYIKLYRELGFDLNNLTNGGEGSKGLKHSEITKNKLRQINIGKKHSIESKKKMSDNNPLKGKNLSEETKNKISKSQKNKPREYNNQEVKVFKYISGEYVGLFISYAECAKQLGLCASHIAKVACGKRKQTGGYIFHKTEK